MIVAIITITSGLNYGNRLQNYALQHFLEKMNISVDNILDVYASWHILYSLYQHYKCFGVKSILKYFLNYKDYRNYVKRESLRQPAFLSFNTRYIRFSSLYVDNVSVPANLSERYDYFIVGSDQVWNPYFKCTDVEFLTFAPQKKRISYAASFGISHMPEFFRPQFEKWLNGMEAISVREDAGVGIVKELTGREAQVHVDPTLLLTQKEWLNIAKKPQWFRQQPYILTYFLGETPRAVDQNVDDISQKYHWKVIRLMDEKNMDYFSIGPDEFIYLVANAQLVYTDSFHGTVFSILMRTPFVICERTEPGLARMTSRIDTLLRMFNMHDRRGIAENNYMIEKLLEMNCLEVETVLNKERERSKMYLKQALHLKDE